MKGSFLSRLIGLIGVIYFSIGLSSAYAEGPSVSSKSAGYAPETVSLYTALKDYTGFTLGADLNNVEAADLHVCAAKMRYGPNARSKVAQLFCSNRKQDTTSLVKFWVNFTSPHYGHKAWKIILSLKGDRLMNAALINNLITLYGSPRAVNEPLGYTWNTGSTHLTLKEDQFGLRLELWDRSLHYSLFAS